MSSKYTEEEDRVEYAVEEAQRSPEKPNFSSLAKKWKVDRLRVWRRYNGSQSRSSRQPANKKLTDSQEQALKDWIRALDRLELSARPPLIEASANQLLRQSWSSTSAPPPVVGKYWVSNFIKRNKDLFKIKQKSRELNRMTLDRRTVGAFFNKFRAIIAEHGIQAGDIWNMDETGFRVGVGGRQWIVTMDPSRDAHLASETCRDTVTCVEAVSATGQQISPMVILGGAQHSPAWVDNNLPDDTLLAVSPNGYTDDLIALKWIRHFAVSTKKMTTGVKRLLVLPPHSSHLLQPLDVAIFQPYKHWHREQVDRATRTGCTNFNKVEFLSALNTIRERTLKPNTIKAGFRLAGLWPINPEVVLSKLPASPTRAAPPPMPLSVTTTNSPSSATPPGTPHTVRALSRVAEEISSRYDESLSPSIARFIKGSLRNAQAADLAYEALRQSTAAQQERNRRNERARKVTQSGGVLQASQARVIVAEKLDSEEKEQARREWAERKREVRKRNRDDGWGKVFAQLRRKTKKRRLVAADDAADDPLELNVDEDVDNVFAQV